MRTLVCGGRDFNDAARVERILDLVMPAMVIHGGARGADTLAGEWAKRRGVPWAVFMADWATHGRAAGPKRNREMLVKGKPHLVIAFPGGAGTADMVGVAMQNGVHVVELE